MENTSDYLSKVPKALLDDVVEGHVVPIVGAGFSKNAIIPDGLTMADWNELGKVVAEQIPGYEYENNPIDTFSYFEYEFGRTNLVGLLRKSLHVDDVHPGETHRLLCELFSGTICTTNYDFLLEDAARLLQRPMPVIVTEGALVVTAKNNVALLKLHGDFNNPERMVITERDYDMYLSQNPVFATYVAGLYISNTMLLIGYSLEDSDFRGIWQVINSRLGRLTRQAYAIEVNASPAKIARFARRGISVVNLPMHPKGYGESVRCFLDELKHYVESERDEKSISIKPEVNAQWTIPAEHNMLCFISCTMKRAAQLATLIDPALQEVGVTPVRVDDVIVPGESFATVTQTALRKSRFVIIDVSDSSDYVVYEAAMAFGSGKPTLLICEESSMTASNPSSVFHDRQILLYSFDSAERSSQFVKALKEWIRFVVAQDAEETTKSSHTL